MKNLYSLPKIHTSLFYKHSIAILAGLFFLIGQNVFGQVSGTVFRDYNANGQKDANEPLVEGIVVSAYDNAGALCATSTTAGSTDPNYTLPTGCSGDLRIEFTIPSNICTANPSIDYSAPSGSVYGSSVQFVASNGTANFAIADPSEYASPTLTNPKLFTVCYVSGNNLGTGNVGAADAFISVDYNPTGNAAPAPAHYSNAAQVGSTWGVAYSKQANKLFTSAVLKRHSGLGPLGSGGIYMIDPTKQLPDLTGTTNFVDFDALGIATQGTGTYAGQTVAGPVIPFSPIIGSNTDRGLGSSLNTGENDAQAVAQSGRVSFGDIDISDDGRYLYVVNLFDGKLYEMDLTNPTNPVAPTFSQIQSWTIPNDCNAAKGTARPWSIGIYKGKVYVGVVCDANISQDKADLSFTIYELNRTTGTFTTIISNTLDFPRGLSNGFVGNGSSRKGWFSWTDDWTKIKAGTNLITWPQPILSDIEFDTDGSLILGFIDRLGLQGGWNNKSPITGDNALYSVIGGGDLLRGYKKSDCTWEIESAGKEGPSSPKPATGGATNNEGPGGGEFYYEDFYSSQHRETALGGLALLRGSGDVVSTIYDPFTYDSFGVGWFDNTTGKKDKGFQVYVTGNNGQTPASGTFSKGLTLGDIEIEDEPAPLEIGNRIFNDSDSDGIQDAGEAGIDGVTVLLFEGTTQVGSTTTANGGQYYFTNANVTGGVKYNTAYEIRIETSQAPLSILSLTTTDAGSSDLIDSDGTTSGANAIKAFTTGNAGENNHSYDFGFGATPPCTPITLGPVPMPGGIVGTPYSVQVIATGGTGPYTFLMYDGSTGSIPPGLTMSPSGLVSGTPTATGSFAVKIIVLDVNMCPDTLDPAAILILCTQPTAIALSQTSATCTAGTPNNDGKITLTAVTGADKFGVSTGATYSGSPDYAAATSIGTLPQDIQTAIPNAGETYTIRFFNGADDCYKDSTVTVDPVNCMATCVLSIISAIPTACSQPNSTYSVSVALTYSGQPNGDLTINGQTFTPNGSGSETFILTNLTANGATGVAVNAAFVNDPNCAAVSVYDAPAACPCPVEEYELCPGDSYNLTADAQAQNVQWFKDGSPISGATNNTYTVTAIGSYHYEGFNSVGCAVAQCCPVTFVPGVCAPACPPKVCLPIKIIRK